MGTLYTIDIGFNWNAPQIGGAFGYETGLYPSSYGIINPSNSSALWPTQFASGDSIRIHLTDITSNSSQTPTDVTDTVDTSTDPASSYRTVSEVAVVFGNPSSGGEGAYPFTSTNPSSGTYHEHMSPSDLPGIVFSDSTEVVFQPSRTDSAVYNAENSGWKVARWYVGSSSGLQLSGPCFSEMSVRLTVSEGSTTKQFLFDPELFVGSTEYGG